MSSNSASSEQLQAAVNKALSFAIERENMDMIRLAMERGAAPATLLDAGMKRANMEMIELALQKGADPHTLMFSCMASAPNNDPSKRVANLVPDPETGLAWLNAALAHGANPNAHKRGGQEFDWPVLHFAQDNFKSNGRIIAALIEHGATVDDPSPFGTPLMRAVASADMEAIEFYIGKGADPTFFCEKQNSFPMQALEDSTYIGTGDKERLLLLMMQHMPATPGDSPAVPSPMASDKAIAVHKPLELKMPPKVEPQRKTFSL